MTTLAKIGCIYCGETYTNGPTAVSDHVRNCVNHPFYKIHPFGVVDDAILRLLNAAVQDSIEKDQQEELQ